MSRFSTIALAALALAGCETTTAVTSVATDHVRVQAVGDDVAPVNATAERACALYKRKPVAMSYRCLDGYCITKEYLFACTE
jgi:hypothetical protein